MFTSELLEYLEPFEEQEYSPRITGKGVLNHCDRTTIFNQIQQTPGDSLIEKMLSWCEENDFDPAVLGEMFSEDKHFKKILWYDAVKMNQVKDLKVKQLQTETEDLDIW